MRARIWPRFTRSPSLTRRDTIRPATSDETLTHFLGRISPEAETLETRSFLPTLPVWTSIFLPLARATLPAITAPTMASATRDSPIFFALDMNPPELPACFSLPDGPFARTRGTVDGPDFVQQCEYGTCQ